MDTFAYAAMFKLGFLVLFASSVLVIYSATQSVHVVKGNLGKGLKKITYGITLHAILIITYLLLEKGDRGVLTDDQISLFFLICGIAGFIFIFMGYLQIFKSAKRLTLFKRA